MQISHSSKSCKNFNQEDSKFYEKKSISEQKRKLIKKKTEFTGFGSYNPKFLIGSDKWITVFVFLYIVFFQIYCVLN